MPALRYLRNIGLVMLALLGLWFLGTGRVAAQDPDPD